VAELTYTDRVSRQQRQMRQMMGHLNVDPHVAVCVDGGLAWYKAQTKCIFCASTKSCADWLSASEPGYRLSGFCPNAAFLQDGLSEILRWRGIVPTD
jgi:Family of unknown function (DUF6455)